MIERIKLLMEKVNLSNSRFSDEIELQRSSLSHILSGRNKPSLDFIMKVKNRFPNIRTDWLIFGNGNMYVNTETTNEDSYDLFSGDIHNNEEHREDNSQKEKIEIGTVSEIEPEIEESVKQIDTSGMIDDKKNQKPSKVVILYDNGTFDVYEN